MDPKAHRLSPLVRPVAYSVDIATHPARPDFEGSVEAAIQVLAPTRTLELHARDLHVHDAHVSFGTHTMHPHIELDPARETVRFQLERDLPVGDAVLFARFNGFPNKSMHGLYLAHDGHERAICTQCEATDARGIFPCFDEPELKASIAWRIRTQGEVVALSNCPLLGVEDHGAEKVWRFEASPPIASYLFALVVGDFEGTSPTLIHGTASRVWALRGKVDQARFAHELTARLLPWYERYFDYQYPFKKYDQVAVPGFDAGAMENVGLVLFRQNLLLMDPRAASWNQEKLIAKVIAHELAHMWFGNLVTMKWWDDLWLNEAFAEWMAHKAVHAVEPGYLVWNDFQGDKNRALVDDALPTTHAVWAPVATPAEAIEMFDVITYQKGCAVMRMLENFLGEERFRQGLVTYMKSFAYKNAAGADLWAHLEQASGEPVGGLMRSWVEQPGFPIVELAVEEHQGQHALQLSQRRFFSSPAGARAPNEQVWAVPMVVRYADDRGVQERRFILREREQREPLPVSGKLAWCCANADEIGFYRSHPTGAALEALLARGPTVLTPVEQMGLVEDQWALVRNASLAIDRFLPVLEAFAGTSDHNVLRSLTDRLGTLDLVLKDARAPAARAGLRRFVQRSCGPALQALGFEPRPGESQNDMQRRALLVHALAVLARDEAVIAEATRWAEKERADPRAVDPNLAGTFVSIAARFGDEARYAGWLDTYARRKAAGAPPQDCLRYLYTLATFRPEPLVARTVEALDDGRVPQEAVGGILAQLLGQRETQGLAWDYFQRSWESLRTRVGDMGLSRVVEAVGFLRADKRSSVVSFFEQHSPKGAERALARALEGMDQREELRVRITPGLVAHFSR